MGQQNKKDPGCGLSAPSRSRVAVPDCGWARCASDAPTAAGCAADPRGSAELGSSTNPRAPTSSRPRALKRAGRRTKEQKGRGKAVGEELGARGKQEGAREKRRRGDGEDLRLLALHPPAPRSSGEREGAPCIPIPPLCRTPAPGRRATGIGGQKLPLS